MPFVYRGSLAALERHALYDGGDCVALIKALVPGLRGISTTAWRQGEAVFGSKGLEPGTAIATFENGRYPARPGKKHAALFLAYGGSVIYVIDQWKNDPRRPWVARRHIYSERRRADGTFANPSNSAEAFYVIELP